MQKYSIQLPDATAAALEQLWRDELAALRKGEDYLFNFEEWMEGTLAGYLAEKTRQRKRIEQLTETLSITQRRLKETLHIIEDAV